MKTITFDFFAHQAANPGASPATLFDLACEQLDLEHRWATIGWMAAANWMDMFANAPTSVRSH